MTPPLPPADAGGLARWRRIRDTLAADLDRDCPEPGHRLPSEAVLAARFAVNRHTVRRALAALAEEGRIRTERGRGSFVASPPLRYRLGARTSFSANLRAAGRVGRRVVDRVAPATADRELAAQLEVAEGARLVRASTRTFADDVPLASSEHHFVVARLPGIDRALAAADGITRALAACGARDVRRARTLVHARPATPVEVVTLDLGPREPVLVTEGLDVAPDGVPLQWVVTVFAASRVELETGT